MQVAQEVETSAGQASTRGGIQRVRVECWKVAHRRAYVPRLAAVGTRITATIVGELDQAACPVDGDLGGTLRCYYMSPRSRRTWLLL